MKKFLLSAVTALVGLSASAASVTYYKMGSPVQSIDDLVTGNYFISVISSQQENLVQHANGYTGYFSSYQTIDEPGTLETTLVYTITVTETDGAKTFTVKNLSTEKYFSTQGHQGVAKGNIQATDEGAENIAVFQLEEQPENYTYPNAIVCEGHRFLMSLVNQRFGGTENGNVSYCHTNTQGGRWLSYWEGIGSASNPGVGTCDLVTLVKAEENVINDVYNVTVHFPVLNGSAITRTYVAVADGTSLAELIAENEQNFTVTSLNTENTTIGEGNTEFTVSGRWGFPAVEPGRVYRMILRDGGLENKYFCWDSSSATTANVATRNATNSDAFTPDRLFYFEDAGTADDGSQQVTLHSLAVKPEYGLTVTTNNNALGTMTTEPTVFKIVSNTSGTAFGGFSLQHQNGAQAHVNDISGNLGIWNYSGSRNDGGSCFRLYALTDADFDNFYTTYTNAAGQSDEILAAAKADNSADNLRALFSTVWGNNSELLDGYYNVSFINAGKAAITVTGYANAQGTIDDFDANGGETTRAVRHADPSAANASQIWQFAEVGNPLNAYNYVKMSSPNANGYYLGTPSGVTNNGDQTHITAMAEYGVSLLFHHRTSDDVWVAQINRDNSYLNKSNQSNRDVFKYGGGFGDGGNKLAVERVNAIDVVIPEGQTYTTACFPLAVYVPEGVEVYSATETQTHYSTQATYVMLEKVSGDVIAAGTGIIVEGNGTISFPIADATETVMLADETDDETAEPAATNLLEGVTLARRGYEAGTHFAYGTESFARNGEEATELTANSAIIPVANISNETHAAADEILLTKTDVTTGIAEVNAATGAVRFYDLNGREVKNPQPGIYVTSNGNKVLVK